MGRNGAGKSTIVEAIGWALYGNDAARTTKDLLKRRGAALDEGVRVHLAFTLHGHRIAVDRRLEGKDLTPTATVSVDGVLVVRGGAGSAREATDYVTRLFHMDRDAFFTSLVARQRELAALTDMTPGKRRELVMRMLRVSAVDEAVKLARARKREVRAVIDALEQQADDVDALGERLGTAREAYGNAEQRHAQALAAEKDAESHVATARKRRDDLAERHDRHTRLTERIASAERLLQARRADVTRLTEELASMDASAKEVARLAPEAARHDAARAHMESLVALRERHAALERRRGELAALREEVRHLVDVLAVEDAALTDLAPAKRQLEETRGDLQHLRATLLKVQGEARDAEADARHLRAEATSLDARLADLARLGPESTCPTCDRPLHDHHGDLTHRFRTDRDTLEEKEAAASARLDAANARLTEAQKRLTELETRERDLDRRVAELTTRATKRDDLTERLQRGRTRLASLAEEVEDAPPWDDAAFHAARADLAATEKARDTVRRLQDRVARRTKVEVELATVTAEVKEHEAALVELREDLKALAFDAAEHAAAVQDLDRAERRLRGAGIAVERAAQERVRLTEEAKRVEEALVKAREARERIRAQREEVKVLEALAGDRSSGVLVQFKDHLAGRIRPLLGDHATSLLSDLTDGRYPAMEVGPDYDILVHDDGDAFDLTRFSGGEQDLANLCLRLAIGQVVAERGGGSEFHVLVLDEIFGSQDDVRKGNVLRVLNRLSARFRQILVITHVEDVRDRVEHVLRVTEEGEGSRAVFEN